MPSFDIISEINWQELDNAINQTNKEALQRYDFKGIKTEIAFDKKEKTITLWCSEEGKLDALNDILQNKIIKRGISLLSLEYQTLEAAFGGSVRQKILIQAGISKDKAKNIIQELKDSKLKVHAQIQDEQVRVSSKSKDDLQSSMALLRSKQDQIKIPMQFSNFRD
ncbi:MAG: YajQ family cyclic di-GMP-binding protein [Bdellovibrio sp.]|nr:YajQ family cyclic di-GMP-binding protein [Bdellovibrio sp.]